MIINGDFINSNNKVIFISGTPCVGKTTIAKGIVNDLQPNYNVKLIKINDFAIENNIIIGKDSYKGYNIVNIEKLDKILNDFIKSFFQNNKYFKNDKSNVNKINNPKIIIVEGHLSHLCHNGDKVIILRCNPNILKNRLIERGYNESKIKENLEAEALGVCSIEAFENYEYLANEIDVTNKSINEVINIVKTIINGEKSYPIGDVDYINWILDNK